jgi:hypothetical protein
MGSFAAHYTQISGFFPFHLEGEGDRGWGYSDLLAPSEGAANQQPGANGDQDQRPDHFLTCDLF